MNSITPYVLGKYDFWDGFYLYENPHPYWTDAYWEWRNGYLNSEDYWYDYS